MDARGVARSAGNLGQQLAQVERVSPGSSPAGVNERAGSGGAEGPLDQRADTLPCERSGPYHRGVCLDLGPRHLVGPRFAVARGHRDQHGEPFQPPSQVGEELERRCVGPLPIVDRQHERLPLREVGDEPEKGVERPGQLAPDELLIAAGQAKDPGRRRGGAGEKRVTVARIGPSQPRFEQLAHHTKGDVALEHPATCPHDIEAGSLPPKHVEEPGLADAGRALDEDDLTVRGGVPHHRAERRQLRFRARRARFASPLRNSLFSRSAGRVAHGRSRILADFHAATGDHAGSLAIRTSCVRARPTAYLPFKGRAKSAATAVRHSIWQECSGESGRWLGASVTSTRHAGTPTGIRVTFLLTECPLSTGFAGPKGCPTTPAGGDTRVALAVAAPWAGPSPALTATCGEWR